MPQVRVLLESDEGEALAPESVCSSELESDKEYLGSDPGEKGTILSWSIVEQSG